MLRIHQRTLLRWGGPLGILDSGALDSCIALPQTVVFGHERFPTLYEKAAAYCFFIARNHPFVQGNKRTALGAAIVFSITNGVLANVDTDAGYKLTTRVAAGAAGLDALIDFFREAHRQFEWY